MPELPDLVIFAKNLDTHLRGRKVCGVTLHRPQKANAPSAVLQRTLSGKQIDGVCREGKEIWMRMVGDGGVEIKLAMHLMLTGKVELLQSPAPDREVLNPIFTLAFEDGASLWLRDRMTLAHLKLNPGTSSTPDALSAAFSQRYFGTKLFNDKPRTIKETLLDQSLVRGIGNAYADEILWRAHVHPGSRSSALPQPVVGAVHTAVGVTLRHAIQELTRAVPDTINSEHREFLAVHNPARATSPTGAAIHCIDIGGKKTYYTDEQRNYTA